uniref:SH2 domain-containing protein n=1 Tax=Syphacia muris TaxID=451379 RepID=A0A0N5AFM6_9BILA
MGAEPINEAGVCQDEKAHMELEELEAGLSFCVEYLGYVPLAESLRKVVQKDRVTNYCMRMVAQKLNLIPPLLLEECSDRIFQMLGDAVIKQENITLNMALSAFVLLDNDERIIEKHPTDLISYASFSTDATLKGYFCFVSHPSEEKGRRCMVFRADTVDFMHKILDKIFNYNHKGSVSIPTTPSHSHSSTASYVNLPDSSTTKLMEVAIGLKEQPWFHGCIDRTTAESKLKKEGDFLVRMSPKPPSNFVLSVITKSLPIHVLLLDEKDLTVREGERFFKTVVDMIDYHYNQGIPIISGSDSAYLLQPIENNLVCAERKIFTNSVIDI